MKLYARQGSKFRRATAPELIATARHLLALRHRPGALLNGPNAVRDYLRIALADLEHEVFMVIFLDARHCVVAIEEMFRGTINYASVYPREVAKAALIHNSAAVILAHNHPSGHSDPSEADLLLTQNLKEVLSLFEIRVLDHLVVGGDAITSLAESGAL